MRQNRVSQFECLFDLAKPCFEHHQWSVPTKRVRRHERKRDPEHEVPSRFFSRTVGSIKTGKGYVAGNHVIVFIRKLAPNVICADDLDYILMIYPYMWQQRKRNKKGYWVQGILLKQQKYTEAHLIAYRIIGLFA